MLRGMVRERRAHHPDDHPQVPRGDGVRRRGDHPAARQARRAAARSSDLTPDGMARDDDRRRGTDGRSRARTGEFGAPRLDIEELSALDDGGQPAVRDVSLAVRAGEIVGIAGVSGNGQRQLVEVLAGQREASGGAICRRRASSITRAAPGDAAHTISRCLPEEPLKNACVAAHERRREHGVPRIRPRRRSRPAAGGSTARRSASAAQRMIARYKIKTRSADTPIGDALRRQRAARRAGARARRRGRHAGRRQSRASASISRRSREIHAEIMAARNRGAAVLLVSEDLDELLELADRMVVMFNGAIVYETPRQRGRPHRDRPPHGRALARSSTEIDRAALTRSLFLIRLWQRVRGRAAPRTPSDACRRCEGARSPAAAHRRD